MGEDMKPTPWVFTESDKNNIQIPLRAIDCERMGFQVCFVNGHREAEAKANSHLIADAFNTLHATGLTPMQLVERVKELEDALSGMVEFFAPYAWGSQENRSDALAAAHAALAKSQGENT